MGLWRMSCRCARGSLGMRSAGLVLTKAYETVLEREECNSEFSSEVRRIGEHMRVCVCVCPGTRNHAVLRHGSK